MTTECSGAHDLLTERLLTEDEAVTVFAELGLQTTKGELAKKRVLGGGPEFHKFGRKVRYTRTGILKYVAAKLSGPLRSTADAQSPSPNHENCGVSR